ncbi:MAG: leucine-rich repeat domain-containing protein, partial [Candidatus Enteromonas sp.]
MEFVEYVNLIRDAKADVRLKTLFDQYPLLKGEDQECAFFLCLLLQNNPNFLDECVEAAKKKDPKQVLDLAFEAEGANVPVTAFIYLIQILSKGIDGSFGEPFYCSLLDDSLAKKYQDKYGKNFGLGTKTNEIEAGPCFSFGNMVVLNSEGPFPWKNVRLSKNEITTAFVGPNVLDVSASCFSDMPNLKTVFLSSEVMHLNEDSFKNCPNLEKVFIGSNITAIGDNAFNGDSRLEFVGHSFKKVSSLGEGCFASCSNIKELSFGGKVKKIPAHAFENMSSLKEITFGSAITSLGEKAFKNCANLEKINGSIEAPVLIKEIFAGDKSLKDFSFLPPQFKAMRNVFDGTSYELKEGYELSEILLEGDCYKRLKAIHPEHYA